MKAKPKAASTRKPSKTADTPKPTEEDISKGLNGRQLAAHLGIKDGTLRSRKSQGKLTEEYIRSKDSDGRMWRFDEDARWPDNLKDSLGGLWFRVE